MIEFKNVSKSYGERKILDNISFKIEENDFFVLVGLSGSGKTTILKMINQLVLPSSGEIKFNQKPITDYDLRKLRFDIGYVLQNGVLFPNMTIRKNIALIPELKGWDKKSIDEEISRLLKIVGLDEEVVLNAYPDSLSGGEKQRIGILRAIISKPKVVLMDEPFSALDPIIRYDLQSLVKQIHQELGITIVFVTHDMREAMKLANKIMILDQGKMIQCDSPEKIKSHPANEFVCRIFESEGLECN